MPKIEPTTDRAAAPELSAEEVNRLASKVKTFRAGLSEAERAMLDAALFESADNEVEAFAGPYPGAGFWETVRYAWAVSVTRDNGLPRAQYPRPGYQG
jgi:hypothetical protein